MHDHVHDLSLTELGECNTVNLSMDHFQIDSTKCVDRMAQGSQGAHS